MTELGTLGDLPADYIADLREANLVPLWPSLRSLLPPDAPRTATRPTRWAWSVIRPLLIRAGTLTPIEKAERRVLVLANPGRGLDNLQASASLYLGMQLVLPGEIAPNHRHTPNAARIAVEGQGALTVVGGQACPMEPGDLVLTPSGVWHEHRHEGAGPFMWLDVLDLPLMVYLDVSYVIQGEPQALREYPVPYQRGGISPRLHGERTGSRYPVLRYAWQASREALEALAVASREPLSEVAYVNPESGADALETIAFSALRLAPGAEVPLPPMSPSRVFHVVDGQGTVAIDGIAMNLEPGDTVCAPGRARIRLAAARREPLWLVAADDSPVHRKLGVFEKGERA